MYGILGLPFSILRRMSVLRPSSLTSSTSPLLHQELKIPTRYQNIALTDVWKDIQGKNSWNGLLDPINPVLKSEILRYGGFAQLCYDAFDSELSTHALGGCKYIPDKLFDRGESASDSLAAYCTDGYEVTQYLYAETDTLGRSIEQSVWIGFIAVCTDPEEIRRLGRRDIVVAWRGTETRQEWIEDVRDILVPARLSFTRLKHEGVRAALSSTAPLKEKGVRQGVSSTAAYDSGVRIEKGFLSCYASVGDDSKCAGETVNIEIQRLVDKYKDESNLSITITGHSLGAALATLSSYDVKTFLNADFGGRHIPVTVFAFASPRVGNRAFVLRMEELGVKVLRLVNKKDIVPKVPGLIFNENSCRLLIKLFDWQNSCRWLIKLFDWLPWTYYHVGVQIVLDNKDIHILDPVGAHNLTVYLRLIGAYLGEGKPFKST